jgi:hypothetical protein
VCLVGSTRIVRVFTRFPTAANRCGWNVCIWVGVAKGEFGGRDGDAAHGHLFLLGLDAVLSTRASLKSSSAADCWPDLARMHGDFL